MLWRNGVLLSLALPVKTCASTVDETESKRRLNVTAEAVSTILATYQTKIIRRMRTLIMSSLGTVDVCRITLQNNVPSGSGKVLGMYSSPRFLLKSYQNDEEEDLRFLMSDDFERELNEEDEYEVQESPEDEEEEEDGEEAEEEDDEGGDDDQDEDIDYNGDGYGDY
ncbi:uncharacterized protein EV420DRAFT_1547974 [Desarmillaria tabescens]|uniref:Uncharacterized protein n=1 Tax=Armillaria tabescens TaxID=1929756 RepID=A0AA39KBS7_ARMTA|nr:uncharacterized protein EV420DRAFT_1547974 [Desarmillaria tabescens]KAK0457898.1 hypothetical protein EV420DRAFT_1547974 [Desarmillaria tabescens]